MATRQADRQAEMGLADRLAPRGTRRRKWAGTVAGALRSAGRAGGLVGELSDLRRSWGRHDPGALEEYLVTGFQNPRINAQSMLMRHFLVRELFGDEFDQLMHDELAHCVRATRALRIRAAELGVAMGSYLDPEKRADVQRVSRVIGAWEDRFERRWAEALRDRKAEPVRVLEFGCGSANDYRFFDSFGIARFLDYTGVDLSDANIGNARRRFPGVDFRVASVLDLPYGDRSVDYVLASDLFEHLSVLAMERALGEAKRLAARGIAITFFSMTAAPEHTVRPVRDYHWNVLSMPRMRAILEPDFGPVTAIRIRDLLKTEFGFAHSYNQNAWTMLARRESSTPPVQI